jgi:hypothetical protein
MTIDRTNTAMMAETPVLNSPESRAVDENKTRMGSVGVVEVEILANRYHVRQYQSAIYDISLRELT